MVEIEEKQIEQDPTEKEEEGFPLKTFDPRDIDISVEQQNIDFLLYKLEYDIDQLEDDFDPNAGIIDLNTEFQRSQELWTQIQMSRLIESILIRFPLPAFYFDTTTKNRWQVIDGLQRLSTLRKFIIEKKDPLRLKGLEFLDREKFENKTFDDLPEPMKRTIRNAQVILILIRPGTPKEVKYRIFERVNTGGLKLNKQEIRHAINQGTPSKFIKELAEMDEFKKMTRVNNRRMEDRELCLRYVAFRLTHFENYQPPMYNFLDTAMEEISLIPFEVLNSIKQNFKDSLNILEKILGLDAFSRQVFENNIKNKKVNKAIFECLLTTLSDLKTEDRNILLNNKSIFIEKYKTILDNTKFIESITIHTSDKTAITNRFELINLAVNETLNDTFS